MNIWILTTEYPPHFGGGIGTYVENVAKLYSKNNDKVKVVLRDNVENIEKCNENLEIHRFLIKNNDKYSFMGEIQSMAYQYFEYIKELLKYEKPDIIEIQEYNAIGYYILQNKYIDKEFLKNIPVVIHLHTPQFVLYSINKNIDYRLPDYWLGQMEKFCIKAADALLCPSQFLADKLQYLNDDTKIKVINLPFDLEENEKNVVKDNNLFLYFGRIEYRKGVTVLIETFEKLWLQGQKCKLKLIGGDVNFYPKNKKLGELLANKYKERIESGLLEFQKNTPQDLLVDEIKTAKAVIIPSLYENFPNTCIMSMWLKKPVIVSKQGGQSEMVDESGVNGYIFDHDIKGDLADKITEVLGASEEKLQYISENARKRIYKLCNIQDNLNQRKKFFTDVINNYHAKDIYPFHNDTSSYKIDKSNNKVLLSIVITYYNLGKYLDETVQSVKQSKYPNKEIIIINDGSKGEENISILEKYRNDDMIKVINIENAGLSNARNVGANNANGDFLAFIDADDKVNSDFYSKAINILNTYNNVSYVFSWVQYFEASNSCWTTFDTQLPYLLCHNMSNANALIRKSDFIRFGKNKIEMEYGMEDYDMWISLAENNCFGVCIPEFDSYYRVRKDSMARGFNQNNLLYLTQKITENHKELYKKYSDQLFNLLNANGPSYLYNNPSYFIDTMNSGNNSSEIYIPSLKDRLWRHKSWRILIKTLQKTGIIPFYKKYMSKNKVN